MSELFRDDIINFIQNFSTYRFFYIYRTGYFLRTHDYLFESYWVVLSKYQKIMAPLLFIFGYHKHIFLMTIQILWLKKHFFKFWNADPLNMIDPWFFNFVRDLHTDNPLVANKYIKNI